MSSSTTRRVTEGASTASPGEPARHLEPSIPVDDEELVRTGLRLILGTEPDLSVVGEAADGETVLAQVAALSPDVVLLDIRMPLQRPGSRRRAAPLARP